MEIVIPLTIILENPPEGIDFGLQVGRANQYSTVQIHRSIGRNLRFNSKVKVKKGKNNQPDFRDAIVQGPPMSRFIYIDIGQMAGQKDTLFSRRLKIPLSGITWEVIEKIASDPSLNLSVIIPGKGTDGGPNCGTVKPFEGWTLSAVEAF